MWQVWAVPRIAVRDAIRAVLIPLSAAVVLRAISFGETARPRIPTRRRTTASRHVQNYVDHVDRPLGQGNVARVPCRRISLQLLVQKFWPNVDNLREQRARVQLYNHSYYICCT